MFAVRSKTPISILQEYCQRNQISPPQYNQTATESVSHQSIFIFDCTVQHCGQEINGQSRGKAKREAKHGAAKQVLKQLHDMNNDPYDPAMTFGETPRNPVTELEDHLKQKGLAMPYFKTREASDGNHHAECRVEHLYAEAHGFSKKTAKREVAKKMIKLLEGISTTELQNELNRLSNIARALNSHETSIEKRVAARNKGAMEICGCRPDPVKFEGRLNEQFECIDVARSEGSTNTFGVGLIKVFMQHRKHSVDGWSEEAFEAFVKLCADNAIPVRESKDIPEFYLILVHLKNPLTFFGTGQKMKFEAQQKTLDYFKSMLDHIQREDKRAKEAEEKKKKSRKQRGYR